MKKGVSETRGNILKVIKEDFYNNYFAPRDIVRSMKKKGLEKGIEKNISVCVNLFFYILSRSGIFNKEKIEHKCKSQIPKNSRTIIRRQMYRYSVGKNFDSYFYFYFNIKPRFIEEKLKLLKEFPSYYAPE